MKDSLYLLTNKSLGRFIESYFQIFPYGNILLIIVAKNTPFSIKSLLSATDSTQFQNYLYQEILINSQPYWGNTEKTCFSLFSTYKSFKIFLQYL